MTRRRRQATETEEQKTTTYRGDSFQQNVGNQVEQLGKGLEGKGKTILYGVLAVAVILILGFVVYSYLRRQDGAAQAALGKAIETSQAQVSASPMPGYPGKVYATDKERSEASIAAFDDVAVKYGNPYRDRAKYLAAMERLKLDREAGLTALAESAKSGDRETASMAKFALAQAKAGAGQLDEAATLYSELLTQNTGLPARDTLNFELAGIYEKQGKTAEAADIYFNIAKAGREAKTADGKPLPMSATARESVTKLEKIAPDKAKELPPEPSLTEAP